MDITWFGQAFFKLKGKTQTVLIDPFMPDFVGLKLPKELDANLVLITHQHQDHSNAKVATGDPVIIEGPGEYDVGGVAVSGVSLLHDSNLGQERGKNSAYNINIDGLNIVHLGDLGHTLNDSQVQEIGEIDILLIPVGGVYTIDAKAAAEVVSELEPKIIIPMHYKVEGLKFELDPVDNFLKEMGVENIAPVSKLTITKDKLPDEPQVVVLTKS